MTTKVNARGQCFEICIFPRSPSGLSSNVGDRTQLLLVLSHNDNDSDAKKRNKLVEIRLGGWQMQKVRRLRAMGLLCRQQAAYNPAQSWKLLAEAEYWEHLAQVETCSLFEECNSFRPAGPIEIRGSSYSATTIAAA